MKTEDNVLLTPAGHQLHLHARDGIRSVRIDRVVSENELSFAHYPALTLSVYDEAGFLLRSEELYAYVQPGEPQQALLSKTFALWDSLTIGIETHGETFDFLLRVCYTINPD